MQVQALTPPLIAGAVGACLPRPEGTGPGFQAGQHPRPPAPLLSNISLPFRRTFEGSFLCPLYLDRRQQDERSPGPLAWTPARPCHSPRESSAPRLSPELHLGSPSGPVPHAEGPEQGRGQQAPAAALASRAHPRGIGPAPGQRLTGGRDRPTHIWRRLFKRLRSSSRPPPPVRLGASSQLFLFYQGV